MAERDDVRDERRRDTSKMDERWNHPSTTTQSSGSSSNCPFPMQTISIGYCLCTPFHTALLLLLLLRHGRHRPPWSSSSCSPPREKVSGAVMAEIYRLLAYLDFLLDIGPGTRPDRRNYSLHLRQVGTRRKLAQMHMSEKREDHSSFLAKMRRRTNPICRQKTCSLNN